MIKDLIKKLFRVKESNNINQYTAGQTTFSKTYNTYSYIPGSEQVIDEVVITHNDLLRCPPILSCLNAYRDTVSGINVELKRINGNKEVNPYQTKSLGYAQAILDTPNGYQCWADFIGLVIGHYKLFGEAFIYILEDTTKRVTLHVLTPTLCTEYMIAPNESAYRVSGSNSDLKTVHHLNLSDGSTIESSKMIHMKDADFFGTSSINTALLLANIVSVYNNILKIINTYSIRATKITGIISVKDDFMEVNSQITDQLAEILREMSNISTNDTSAYQNLKANADNLKQYTNQHIAGGILHVPAGTDYTSVKPIDISNPTQAELLDITARFIASALNVPLSMIGLEAGKFNNHKQQQNDFYSKSVSAFVTKFEQLFNSKVIVGTLGIKTYKFRFMTEEYLKGSPDDERKNAIELLTSGIITANEARSKLGLEKLIGEGYDDLAPNASYRISKNSPQDTGGGGGAEIGNDNAVK